MAKKKGSAVLVFIGLAAAAGIAALLLKKDTTPPGGGTAGEITTIGLS